MKKTYSLIKACMTSDMNLFKIKSKKKNKKNILLPLVIAGYLMFMVWGGANSIFEKLAPIHVQYILLSVFVLLVSIMTIVEGIYKSGSLMFNCKDDDLLFSLPIKKRTVLFVRIFKFYVFELLFNSLFILPCMVAYIRWADNLNWTYYLTSIVMLLLLPIIPIVISCIIGAIISSLSSRFKYKNLAQIIISILFFVGIMYLSYNTNSFIEYLIAHAVDINDLITKIYYPAGAYATLVIDFSILKLLVFILIHIAILSITIFVLSKFYFRINSRLKKVESNKKVNVDKLTIKASSQHKTLIKKELTTFFKTPVLIINAGFALVLFMIAVIAIVINFDKVMITLAETAELNISKEFIMSKLAIFIYALIAITSYMTSITNSLISLEGKNINILKSLPINTKTILMSKIYTGLVLTTPVLLTGTIILGIKFKVSIIELLLLIILSIFVPLMLHFIGLIVNLKYPKLDAESSTEIVKQSASSFISVTIGMVLMILCYIITKSAVNILTPTLLLAVSLLGYLVIDIILYIYLIKKGTKEFDRLTV